MNTYAIRSAFAAAMIAGTLAATTATAAEAAEPTDHPDFAWWPSAKPSNRLYVGNLSGPIGSSEVQFNPYEFSLDKKNLPDN